MDTPSKKQKTGDKASRANGSDPTHKEVIPAQDALPVTRVQLYNGGQGIVLGFRVPKDYFLATGAGDTNEVRAHACLSAPCELCCSMRVCKEPILGCPSLQQHKWWLPGHASRAAAWSHIDPGTFSHTIIAS